MEHGFDIDLAREIGIVPAILLKHIYFWVEKNRANEKNIHDGKAWTYNSLKAFEIIFPYLTIKQIRYALEKLKECGLIETAILSEDARDRTLWYTVNENGIAKIMEIAFSKFGKSDLPKLENLARDYGIYNINTDINTDIRNAREKERLNKPLNPQEVIEEAGKRLCIINESQAQDFIDKYEAVSENGTWVCGKSVVTDWRKLITSGWIKGWQKEYREASKQNAGSPDDNRQTLEELSAEIARERAARRQL